MNPFLSWTLLLLVVGGLSWYYINGPNSKNRFLRSRSAQDKVEPQLTLKSKTRKNRGKKAKGTETPSANVNDLAVDLSSEVPDTVPDAPGARKRKAGKGKDKAVSPDKVVETLGEEKEIAIANESPDEGMDNTEFAKRYSNVKKGTSLAGQAQSGTSKNDRRASKMASRLAAIERSGLSASPDLSTTTSSTTGADADDDVSPVASPPFRATSNLVTSVGGDVSDMLEAPAAGPSVLRLTDPIQPVQHRQSAPQPFQAVESKKQRQQRKKAEDRKVAIADAENERRFLLEKQLRTARLAEGSSAETKSKTVSKLPAQNVWKGQDKNSMSDVASIQNVWKVQDKRSSSGVPSQATTTQGTSLLDTFDSNGSDRGTALLVAAPEKIDDAGLTKAGVSMTPDDSENAPVVSEKAKTLVDVPDQQAGEEVRSPVDVADLEDVENTSTGDLKEPDESEPMKVLDVEVKILVDATNQKKPVNAVVIADSASSMRSGEDQVKNAGQEELQVPLVKDTSLDNISNKATVNEAVVKHASFEEAEGDIKVQNAPAEHTAVMKENEHEAVVEPTASGEDATVFEEEGRGMQYEKPWDDGDGRHDHRPIVSRPQLAPTPRMPSHAPAVEVKIWTRTPRPPFHLPEAEPFLIQDEPQLSTVASDVVEPEIAFYPTQTSWADDLPSEEEQIRMLNALNSENEWMTVRQRNKKRSKSDTAAVDGETVRYDSSDVGSPERREASGSSESTFSQSKDAYSSHMNGNGLSTVEKNHPYDSDWTAS